MKLNEEILKTVEENTDLTISKLARKMNKPRIKISALVESLEEEGKIKTFKIATGKVVRINKVV